MIARVWSGVTPESKAKQYLDYLMETGVKDARSIEGNRGVVVLRRVSEGHAEFLVISLWDSLDDIRQFVGIHPFGTGKEIDTSRYYPADTEYLISLEPEVTHYDVLLGP